MKKREEDKFVRNTLNMVETMEKSFNLNPIEALKQTLRVVARAKMSDRYTEDQLILKEKEKVELLSNNKSLRTQIITYQEMIAKRNARITELIKKLEEEEEIK